MRNLLSLLFILMLLSACSLKPGRGLDKTTDVSDLDQEIELFMLKWKIRGGTVAVVKDDKLIYSKAFGHNLDKSPMSTLSSLKIASLSKQITAVGIVKLVEQGKVTLDAKVFGKEGILNDSAYSKIIDPRVYNITVEQLLTHTGGWDRNISEDGDPMFNSLNIGNVMSQSSYADSKKIIEYMLSKNLDFDPGSKYAYSNLGYSILGRVIEKVSGVNYESFIKMSISIPLDMKHMHLAKNDEYPASSGHPFINIEAMDSHGGWKASSVDLAKFSASMVPGSKYQILQTTSIAEMLEGSTANPCYGLGWCVNEKGNCWHTGSLDQCSAFMARLKTGVCAVVLFNNRPEDPAYFTELDKLVWTGMKKVKTWPTKDLFIEDKIAYKIYHIANPHL